jgi:large subunit ribosomal protein L26e
LLALHRIEIPDPSLGCEKIIRTFLILFAENLDLGLKCVLARNYFLNQLIFFFVKSKKIDNIIMKTHSTVSSSRRKNRKAHFAAPSHLRYKLMSCSMSKELRAKYGVKSMPVRKDDEVTVLRGKTKDHSGKVNQVYRKRWCLYIEGTGKAKPNGQQIRIPINASNCMITKLRLTKDRLGLISRKCQNSDKLKGKVEAPA